MPEPKTVKIDNVELLLSGSVLDTPMKISGIYGKGDSGSHLEFWGAAAYEKSLPLFLQELSAKFDPSVGDKLAELLGEQAENISLERLVFGFRSAEPKIAQFIVTVSAGSSRSDFSAVKSLAKEGGFAIGLNLKSDGMFLKSNALAGLIGQVAVKDLGVHYASRELKQVPCYPEEASGEAIATPRDFAEGWRVSADIMIGSVNLFDGLASGRDKIPGADTGKTPAPEPGPAGAKDSIQWIEAGKTIGPLSVRRIGLGYQAPRIAIKLDAGLKLSCLNFSLEGLGLSYPIDQFSMDPQKIWDHLRFNLDGASLGFSQGPLTISGGLLKVSDEPLQLDGTLLVRTPVFAISAIASYAHLNGTPSFFMFAALQKELGGPAFFFITGLAFGFGVNRSLKLPPIGDVENFPLIRAATDENYLGAKLDLRAVSQKLGQYVSPSEGNYWIAAGIKFSSFGQIDSFVLLSVSFGTRLEFGLLGLSKMQVPKLLPGSADEALPVIVYAEMAIRAVVAPDTGLLCFEAKLTENSFLLRKDFKLRGGFAFYSWFAGDHEGDFAVAIGGYHNKFKLPPHYPRPDLVEFSCKIGDTVTMQGSCYFALCPSAIMAGGRFSIVYQTEQVRAWFIAYAHFLIQWKPVYYDIAIGVSVGVALHLKTGPVRINMSVELAATLDLYGPPLGGKATLSLHVITISVLFGEGKTLPASLLWESGEAEKSFAKAFLPKEVTRITLSDGLLKSFEDSPVKIPALVNPHKLALNCHSAVPATEIRYNGKSFNRSAGDAAYRVPQPKVNGKEAELGVRPLGQSKFHSLLEITLEPVGNASAATRDYLAQYINVMPAAKSVPLALWGNTGLDLKAPPEAQMIDDALVGLVITTKPGPRTWETEALDLKVLAFEPRDKQFDWTATKPADAFPANNLKAIENLAKIEESGIAGRRNKIVELLQATHPELMNPGDIKLPQLSANAQYIFQAPPLMARVGQEPPRTNF